MRAIVTNIIRDLSGKLSFGLEVDGRDTGISVGPEHKFYKEWERVAASGRLTVIGGIKAKYQGEDNKEVMPDLENSDVYPM